MWKNMLMSAIAGVSPYVLALTTSLFAISFSTSAYASQTSAQHKTLFKVPYLDEPTGLRVHFPGTARLGDDMEKPLRGGGPTTFCVSWDGRLFYIADPLRAYDKYLEPPYRRVGTLGRGSSLDSGV